MAGKFKSPGQAVWHAIDTWKVNAFFRLKNEIIENLSGKVLRRRTGTLVRSIGAYSRLLPTGLLVGTQQKYGIAWEEGFTRKAYTVFPKHKKALRFKVGGQVVFAKRARIPSKRFKARPFIAPAVRAEIPRSNKELNALVERNLKDAFPDIKITIKIRTA